MLKFLSIRNVVLIDNLDLDFPDGFVVFSGETGAGKSILLDSLGLLLGRRGDTSLIRAGCDKLSVSGVFEIRKKNAPLEKILSEYEIDFDTELVIKRSLNLEGKGKIFVNDQPITQKLLKEIGSCLVEIHGQFDNQGLLDATTHRDILDSYGGYADEVLLLKSRYAEYKKAKEAYLQEKNRIAEAQRDEENLRHWLQEFEMLKPQEKEQQILEEKRRQMMNAEKILENLDGAYKALSQNFGVYDALRQTMSFLAKANNLVNERFSGIYDLLDSSLINAQEAEAQIKAALDEISWDSRDANALEERLFALKNLARKHGVDVSELPKVWQQIEHKLQNLDNAKQNEDVLRMQLKQAEDAYKNQAEQVSILRKNAARKLDENVMKELPQLKMDKAVFVTKISTKDAEKWNENGKDEVCFTASTNPNSAFEPISKIASGGELARFMLALKVNLAQTSAVETMIFDEVDSGLGGAAAQAVGEKLANLGKNAQVMAVTHAPQIAALGQAHFKVEKNTEHNIATTAVKKLDEKAKNEEVARMLSGELITDEARAAAKVLIGV